VPGYGEVRGEQGEDRGEEREAVRPDRQLQRAALRDLRARRVRLVRGEGRGVSD
jgi:hypothetical protein